MVRDDDMTYGKTADIYSFPASRGNAADFCVRRQAGFTMLELVVVIAIIAIIAGFTVPNLMGVRENLRANQAMYQVMDSLREARMLALSQRINICMNFPEDNRIEAGLWDIDSVKCDPLDSATTGGALQLTDPSTTLEGGYWFNDNDLDEAKPGFGKGAGIVFGGIDATDRTLVFTVEGFLTDAADLDNPVNGTIFIGPSDGVRNVDNRLARAVTIIGATGHLNAFHYRNGWKSVR